MQSAEADRYEMDGGYSDGLGRFSCIHRPWFQPREYLINNFLKMQSAEADRYEWKMAIAMA